MKPVIQTLICKNMNGGKSQADQSPILTAFSHPRKNQALIKPIAKAEKPTNKP
jgi:hypothetical protein